MSESIVSIPETLATPPATPHDEPMAAEAPIALAPQERQARAEAALAQTHERIQALGEALASIEPRRAELAERERQAATVADLLTRSLAAQPTLINAAQARLLVVAGTPAEASVQQALSAAREHAERVDREEAEARAVLAATRAETAQQSAELDASASQAEAERAGLVGLVEHLQHEVADARRAVGEELLAATGARAAVLRAEVEAAEARLAEARAVLEQHQANAAATLASYPDAHEQARQAGLLPVEALSQVERLLVPYLAYLRALERVGWFAEMPLYDHMPLSAVLGALAPAQLHYALTADPAAIAPHVRYVEQLLASLQRPRPHA